MRRYLKQLRETVSLKQKRYYQPLLDMVPGVQIQVDCVFQTKTSTDEVEYVLKRYGDVWTNNHHADNEEFTLEERQKYHYEYSLPVMEELKNWCETYLDDPETEGNGGLAKAMKYYLKHYSGLSLFCFLPGAGIDNNYVERIIKLIVRNRKNSGMAQTRVPHHGGAI